MIGPHGSPAKLISGEVGFPQEISPNILAVVVKALHQAWDLICGDPAKHLAPVTSGNPEEDRYTDALCEILTYWLHEPDDLVEGFTSDVFEEVNRGANLSNYNQSVINKQPDLVIRLANAPLVNARRYVGIFVEAKIVSAKKGLSLYTKDGVARFVRGDYAWAMQDSLMIAYQKTPHRALKTLDAKLKKEVTLFAAHKDGIYLEASGLPTPVSAKSTHHRQWTYSAGGQPGVIRIWHLWAFALPD